MKIVLIPALLFSLAASAQTSSVPFHLRSNSFGDEFRSHTDQPLKVDIKLDKPKWKMDKNKILTGGLTFIAGFAKGFNEALQYKYNGFEEIFPYAKDQWFYPTFSFKNKYKDHDPEKGARFPGSTSVFVMFTDQYHLNNFIQKTALTAALVLKIGEKKKPFKHYLLDVIYYTACYQVGFHSVYQPISARNE